VLYDDGTIACDDTELIVRRRYPWRAKRIPYSSIRSVRRRPLSPVPDPGRRYTPEALEIELGRRSAPTITPDDPKAVERIVREHLRQR
jgi:hypothetical protein